MRAQNISVHIDEIVLEGHAGEHPERFGDALQRELTRLLATGRESPLTRDLEIAHLDGGVLEPIPAAGTERTGVRVAGAIHAALKR